MSCALGNFCTLFSPYGSLSLFASLHFSRRRLAFMTYPLDVNQILVGLFKRSVILMTTLLRQQIILSVSSSCWVFCLLVLPACGNFFTIHCGSIIRYVCFLFFSACLRCVPICRSTVLVSLGVVESAHCIILVDIIFLLLTCAIYYCYCGICISHSGFCCIII